MTIYGPYMTIKYDRYDHISYLVCIRMKRMHTHEHTWKTFFGITHFKGKITQYRLWGNSTKVAYKLRFENLIEPINLEKVVPPPPHHCC